MVAAPGGLIRLIPLVGTAVTSPFRKLLSKDLRKHLADTCSQAVPHSSQCKPSDERTPHISIASFLDVAQATRLGLALDAHTKARRECDPMLVELRPKFRVGKSRKRRISVSPFALAHRRMLKLPAAGYGGWRRLDETEAGLVGGLWDSDPSTVSPKPRAALA